MFDNRREVRDWLDDATTTEFYNVISEAKLSPRQRELVINRFVSDRLNYGQAEDMDISPETVRNDFARIFDKCGRVLKNRDYANELLGAMNLISDTYYRIFRVNLDNGNFTSLKNPCLDDTLLDYISIENSFRDFALSDRLCVDDRKPFLNFASLKRLKSIFISGVHAQRIKYRRRVGDLFRWVMMEILPTKGFCEENPTVMLYVRDLDDLAGQPVQVSNLTDLPDLEAFAQAKKELTYCSRLGVIRCSLKPQVTIDEPIHIFLYKISFLLKQSFIPNHCYKVDDYEFIIFIPEVEPLSFENFCSQFSRTVSLIAKKISKAYRGNLDVSVDRLVELTKES